MNSANSIQHGGNHYKGGDNQHWDYVIHALGNRYLEGQITKYLFRWRDKNGIEDLRKAEHYALKLLEAFVGGFVFPPYQEAFKHAYAVEFVKEKHMTNTLEGRVFTNLARWHNQDCIRSVLHDIRNLLQVAMTEGELREARKAGAAPMPGKKE